VFSGGRGAVEANTDVGVFDGVKSVVVETLGIEDRADTLTASTPLLGSLPELDSMAVVELVAALEARFDIHVDDDEVSADVFETLGSLAALVGGKLA
jgi:acyl carrier protein